MADPFSDALTAVVRAVQDGRPLFGGRGLRLDTDRVGGLLDRLLIQAACAVRAIGYYERRRSDEGDPALGVLAGREALFAAIEELEGFLGKRRADIASFGRGTVVSRTRLDELVARLEEVGEPYAKRLRDFRALFPDVDQQAMFADLGAPTER